MLFFDKKGNILNGEVIGTKGSWNNSMNTVDKVYDGDPLTFFDSPESSGACTGLDLGKYVEIDRNAFLLRNDDNHIRGGDEYKLFYRDKEWVSLGKQIGVDSENLIYANVPKGAMLLLKNHTRGMQERMFTYENGKQFWR